MKIVGIYKIENLINKKIYIGSSIDITKRWRKHKFELNKNIHPNTYLQRAWNKYGSSNFSFKIIEYCGQNNIASREQSYLNSLNPEYNLCKIAYSSLGRKATEETKALMSSVRIGLKHTEASKKLMRNIAIEKGTTISNKARQKSIEVISKPVVKYSKDNELLGEYKSIVEASLDNGGINRGNITEVCKNRRSTAGGFIWKYKKVV